MTEQNLPDPAYKAKICKIFLVIAVPFFGLNLYNLTVSSFEIRGCDRSFVLNETLSENCYPDENITDVENDWQMENGAEIWAYCTSYPCQWGFWYLFISGLSWSIFLPFWILVLIGNCRGRSICMLDQIATKIEEWCRCCKTSVISLIWHGHCFYHIIVSIQTILWIAGYSVMGGKSGHTSELFKGYGYNGQYDINDTAWNVVLGTSALDFVISSSEMLFRVKLLRDKRAAMESSKNNVDTETDEGQMMTGDVNA